MLRGVLKIGSTHRPSSYQTLLPEMAQPLWLCLFSSRLPCTHTKSSEKHNLLLLESEELDSRLSACATIKKLGNYPEPQCSPL